ncbi:hypothetical protein PG614_02080 [Riemerella anatipestifer]|nr:hypothetical protein [Riemerella anatipestifer]MDY3534729.1 hypothetical protein [Riemerella anatipestifer]
MKKNIFLASVLLGTLAYGQINTQSNPNPVINQENPFLDASGYNRSNNNVGKGLYFPKTDLTTWEFKTSTINPGKFSTYFDGMIVYNTGSGKTLADTSKGGKQVEVTPGFYYFKNLNQTSPSGSVANGEWVRLSDTQANAQLWAQRANGSDTETYLIPASTQNDSITYRNRKFNFNLGNYTKEHGKWLTNLQFSFPRYHVDSDSTPFQFLATSDALPKASTQISVNNNTEVYYFKNNGFEILESHVASNPTLKNDYHGNLTFLETNQDVTSELNSITATYSRAYHGSNANISSITGGNFGALNGSSMDNITPTVTNTIRGIFVAAVNDGIANAMYGSVIGTTNNGSSVGTLMGIRTTVNAMGETTTGTASITDLYGVSSGITVPANVTIAQNLVGSSNAIGHYGNANNVYGNFNYIYARSKSTSKNLYGFRSAISVESEGSVENLRGVDIYTTLDTNAIVKDLYGLYISNIRNAQNNNYAIYTNFGENSFGDTVTVRNMNWSGNQETIFQFMNGSLKINSGIATSQIVDQMNGGGAGGSNLVFKTQSPISGTDPNLTLPTEKMRISADGNVGIGVNAPTEKLEVSGKVKANTFIATQAGSVFPDYVFQKYYTGTSSLKTDYSFKTLSQVEDFVKTNGHLPGYQSAEAIKKQGYIDLMATQLTNVEKIEELYLHSIEQDKALKAKDARIETLENKNKELEARLQKLEALLVK